MGSIINEIKSSLVFAVQTDGQANTVETDTLPSQKNVDSEILEIETVLPFERD